MTTTSEEFDLEHQGNPKMLETVTDFLMRQRKLVSQTDWPPGTRFECKKCADCCTWFFMLLVVDEELNVELRKRVKYPHGSWIMEEGENTSSTSPSHQISLQMPGYRFTGNIPVVQAEYMTKAGRHWGYWVLNATGKVALYNPTPCIRLVEGMCEIYEDRPQVCKEYFCRRHAVIS